MTVSKVKDRETISSLTTAVGFTAAKLTAGLFYATIQAIDGDIRYTEDGTTPTDSLGLRLPEDGMTEIWGTAEMANFRCIYDGGTAKLEVLYMER